MTRIDFYIQEGAQEAERITCKIVQKAYKSQLNTYIHTNSLEQCQMIDKLLWSFSDTSFIPHGIMDDFNQKTPVHIGYHDIQLNDTLIKPEILINLADEVPIFFSSFARMAEIISAQAKVAGRKRYKFYQDRGYALNTHSIKD